MRAAADTVPSSPVAAFPWDEAMTAAFSLLRLSPDTFWRMSPREFARAVAPFATSGADPMRRPGLAALMARFPDNETR